MWTRPFWNLSPEMASFWNKTTCHPCVTREYCILSILLGSSSSVFKEWVNKLLMSRCSICFFVFFSIKWTPNNVLIVSWLFKWENHDCFPGHPQGISDSYYSFVWKRCYLKKLIKTIIQHDFIVQGPVIVLLTQQQIESLLLYCTHTHIYKCIYIYA